MAGFRRIRPGQDLDRAISAEAYNAMLDDLEARRGVGGVGVGGSAVPQGPRTVIQGLNDTDHRFEQFEIVGLTAPVINPIDSLVNFKTKTAMKFTEPEHEHASRFGITLAPIGSDQMGSVAIAGLMPVRVEMIHEAHRYAKAITGDKTKLRSAAGGGARIVWVQAGTGTKWALVDFPYDTQATVLLPTANIERFAHGDAKIAKAVSSASVLSASTDLPTVRLSNLTMRMIWKDAPVIALPVTFQAETGEVVDHYVAVQAFSATRMRARAAADIPAGGSGLVTLASITPIDGHYSTTTPPTVYVPTDHVSIASNIVLWAELRWNGIGSIWEVYSADCEEA